jgi:hypothetical protein
MRNWFEVDKDGLAKLLERKGKAFALFELIQNAWDTRARFVHISIERVGSSPNVFIRVTDDDPEGFKKLEHAFTLFAESDKKSDPTKRGRFNLGEKLVLALCRSAQISSTSGTVMFDSDGRRRTSKKTEEGSTFEGEMRMTREEVAEVESAIRTLLVPDKIATFLNGERLSSRKQVTCGVCTLKTEISDAEGYLRPTERKTTITLYEVLPGEKAHLYELGIPVVELPGGDRWHVDVAQKVPLNVDRDNVTPSYLQRLRVEVLNLAEHLLRLEDSTTAWVRDASAHEDASDDAIRTVMGLRYGDKRVIFDPTDPEGTKLAASQGYTVIPGGSMSAGEWDNVRRAGAALPAGQVTPSPKPYSPDGRPEKVIPVSEWTPEMGAFAERAGFLGWELMGVKVTTRFVKEPGVYWRATYSRGGHLAINVSRVGRGWFEGIRSNLEDHIALLIHEFGHEYSSDHLSEEYHQALCRLGAKLAIYAAEGPSLKNRLGMS